MISTLAAGWPGRRRRDDHLGHERAVGLARRLRHHPGSLASSQSSSALVTLAQRAADRPRPEHDLLLPRDVGDAAGNTSTEPPAAHGAAELHDSLREPHRHHRRRLRRRDARTPTPTSPRPGTARSSCGRPWAQSSRRPGAAGRLVRASPGTRRRRRQRDRRGRSARTSTAPLAGTSATYGSGRSLEFVATFGGGNFQHVGFGVDFNNDPDWAIFSIKGDGTFNARDNNGGAQPTRSFRAALIGSPHRYRIEWDADRGPLLRRRRASSRPTRSLRLPPRCALAASDLNAGGADVVGRLAPHEPVPAAGSFNSRVFDAGQQVAWGTLSGRRTPRPGPRSCLSVRTGNTPTPDGSWSSFTPIATNGGDIPGNSRYVQYRADLTPTGPGSDPGPERGDGRLHAGADTTPPTIVRPAPAPERHRCRPRHATSRSSSASRWTRPRSTPRPSACARRAPAATSRRP